MVLSAHGIKGTAIAAATLFWVSAGCGCGGATAAPAPPASPAAAAAVDDDATFGLMEHHRHHHHGGVTLFLAMSLDTLGVSPAQQEAVETIRGDLHARMAPALAAEQTLVGALADGVTADHVDKAQIEADVARVVAATAAAHDASADALNELHRVLDAPERAALVDKVQAHWAVWQQANADENATASAAKPQGGHLAALTEALDLTAGQVDTIRAALREGTTTAPRFDPTEVSTYLRAFGDAFQSETFDARAFLAARDVDGRVAGRGADLMARLVEATSPVLTADQRAELAQRLRLHATHNPSTQREP